MSKKIKILTPKIYEHGDFFHNAIDFAREHSLNTNELCLELSHYLVDNFDKVWKIEKPRVYKRVADLEAKLAKQQECSLRASEKHNLEMQNTQICIKELEAKLAEKEKEIARLKLLVDGFDKLKQYDKDADLILINPKTCYADGKELVIKSDNQDKISFCIEQLEKMKELGVKDFNLGKGNLALARLIDKIDNQIKQLKEMK